MRGLKRRDNYKSRSNPSVQSVDMHGFMQIRIKFVEHRLYLYLVLHLYTAMRYFYIIM